MTNRGAETTAIVVAGAIILFGIILTVAFYGAIAAVAIHFIHKFW